MCERGKWWFFQSKPPGFLAYQQQDKAGRVPSQYWNEPDDKKYNLGRHEMGQGQGHGHVKGFRARLPHRSKPLKP